MTEIWTNEGDERRIVIEPSLWADDSPRAECATKGRLICAPHPKYPRFADETVTPERLEEIAAEAEAREADVRLVSIYEHGGVAVKLGPATDPWDSGQIGIYVIEKPGDGSPVDEAALTAAIKRELQMVSAWLNNEAFDAVEKRRGTGGPGGGTEWEEVPEGRMGPFYGNDHAESGLLERAGVDPDDEAWTRSEAD